MRAYLGSIWQCRYFWLSLVRNDLRTRYRGSVLGMGWSLLNPIAMTVILCVVFATIFHQPIREFAPFLMAGLTYWNYITFVSLSGAECYFQGESYIRQYPAPMAIYPLRTMLGGAFHFLLAVMLVVVMAYTFLPSPPHPLLMLMLIPTLLLLGAFGWSLAVLFGLATVRFRDTRHISELGFQAMFYATPIMYPEELLRARHLDVMMRFNPFSHFLRMLRDPLIHGHMPSPNVILASCLVTLIAVAMAVLALRAEERRLIFYL
jgi:ABC-type polysaccharide/polyol phosphate export permease